MFCSYCNGVVFAKCGCTKPYMCESHLGPHLKANGNHPYELVKPLEGLKLERLRKLAIETIIYINKAKSDIAIKTKTLLSSIGSQYEKAMENIDNLIRVFNLLVKSASYFDSDIEIIENLETKKLTLKDINLDMINVEAEKVFLQDLIIYNENHQYKKIQFLNKHVGGLICGAVTKDNDVLLTGGTDSTIRAWDLTENKQLFVLYGHGSRVQCLAMTEDSKQIISGSWDASLRIWSFEEQKQIAVLKGHKGAIFAMCYLEKGSLIISGDTNCELLVWDFKNHLILIKFETKNFSYSIIGMKNQSKIIVGLNPEIAIYGLEDCNLITTLLGHSSAVWSLALTTINEILISGSENGTIIVWNLKNLHIIFSLREISVKVNSICLTLDEKSFVTGSNDNIIRIWNLNGGFKLDEYNKHTLYVNSISKSKNKLISVSHDAAIGKLDIAENLFEVDWFLKPFINDFIDFSSNLGLIGYGSKNEAVIWDLNTEKHVFLGHGGQVQFVEISNDSKFAISGSASFEMNLFYWDLEKNQKICELKGHSSSVFCAAFSDDGIIAASGSADKTIRIWNLRNGKQESELKEHTNHIYSIKFIDKKKLLVSAGEDKQIRIWNLIDNSLYAVLYGHNYAIWKIIVAYNDKYVVSGDFYEGIRVWNVDLRQQEFSFILKKDAKEWLKNNKIPIESVKRFLKV